MPEDYEQPESSGVPEPEAPGRRSFLRGALGAGVSAGVAGAALGAAGGYADRSPKPTPATQVAADQAATGRLPAVPFHGRYQAGILPDPQPATTVVSFDATAEGRGELTDLLQALTSRARGLTAGGAPPPP